jgi:hypothetical protein
MIYVRPLAGLCNRIRSIDSAIELAKIHNRKLTIIWVMSPDLNAKLSDLYDLEELKKHLYKIKQIDPNAGFKQKLTAKILNRIELSSLGKVNNFKNKWAMRFLLADFKLNIAYNNKELENIIAERIDKSSTNHLEQEKSYLKTLRELLNMKFKKHASCYLESCYRLESLDVPNAYDKFIPKHSLQSRIHETTGKFNKTIGVHIRRTDHHYAIQNSPTQLFMEIISTYLEEDKLNTAFLCTDDEETKNEILDRFGSKIFTADIKSLKRDDPKGIEDALVDLMCLAKTNKIFGSHFSSFSQVAADIGRIEVETVLKRQ